MTKISAYPSITTPVRSGDLADISEFDGVSAYTTKRITLGTLAPELVQLTGSYDNATSGLTATDIQSAIDEVESINFYRNDGALTGARIVDLASNLLTLDNGQTLFKADTSDSSEFVFQLQDSGGFRLMTMRNDGNGAWGTALPTNTANFTLSGTNSNTAMNLVGGSSGTTLNVSNTASSGASIVANSTGANSFSIAVLNGSVVFRQGAPLTCGQNSADTDSQLFATTSGSGRTYSLQALEQSHIFTLKVGTAGVNNAGAALQVDSVTGGILWPRMTSTQASAITGVDGLTLYVTDTNGTFTSVGFWGYENAAWTKL